MPLKSMKKIRKSIDWDMIEKALKQVLKEREGK